LGDPVQEGRIITEWLLSTWGVRLRKVSASSLVGYSKMANSHQHQLAESSMGPGRLYNYEAENSCSCRENDPWSSNPQSETLVNELAGLPVVVVAAIIIQFNSIQFMFINAPSQQPDGHK